jgi:hypothetical protein
MTTDLVLQSNATITERIDSYFDKFDRNNDRKLTDDEAQRAFNELTTVFERAYNQHNASVFIRSIDLNRDGYVNLDEFRYALHHLYSTPTTTFPTVYTTRVKYNDHIAEMFSRLDKSGNGYLDAYEQEKSTKLKILGFFSFSIFMVMVKIMFFKGIIRLRLFSSNQEK